MGDEGFWDFDGDGELNGFEVNMMMEDIDEEINGRHNQFAFDEEDYEDDYDDDFYDDDEMQEDIDDFDADDFDDEGECW
ncbi:MAG: hypothetical protein K5644_03440 [Lachnospiraceae bacterium]|nr:hypothetical protein [Lachnospiraceae bacterium]